MNKRFLLILEIAIALTGLLAGYIFIVGKSALDTPAVAHSATAPDNPLMLYLAPEGKQRGLVNDQKAQNWGATPVRDWTSARAVANSRSLDALLIDADMFNTMTVDDSNWLQAQFHAGVIIVGLGAEEKQLASALGLKTLRGPDNTDTVVGPTEYWLVSSLILGHPDEVKMMEGSDWINRHITEADGGGGSSPILHYPLVTSVRIGPGKLDSEAGLTELTINVKLGIEAIYQTRAEYQQALKDFERK